MTRIVSMPEATEGLHEEGDTERDERARGKRLEVRSNLERDNGQLSRLRRRLDFDRRRKSHVGESVGNEDSNDVSPDDPSDELVRRRCAVRGEPVDGS